MSKKGVQLQVLELAILTDARLGKMEGKLGFLKSLSAKGFKKGMYGGRDFDSRAILSSAGLKSLFSGFPCLEKIEMHLNGGELKKIFDMWKKEKRNAVENLKSVVLHFKGKVYKRGNRGGDTEPFSNANQVPLSKLISVLPNLESLTLFDFGFDVENVPPENKLSVVHLHANEVSCYWPFRTPSFDFISLLSSCPVKELHFGMHSPPEEIAAGSGLKFPSVQKVTGFFGGKPSSFGNFLDCLPNLKYLETWGEEYSWLNAEKLSKLESITLSAKALPKIYELRSHLPPITKLNGFVEDAAIKYPELSFHNTAQGCFVRLRSKDTPQKENHLERSSSCLIF